LAVAFAELDDRIQIECICILKNDFETTLVVVGFATFLAKCNNDFFLL